MSEFGLPPEEMRRLGYKVIDAVVDHWSRLRDKPAMRVESRPELERRLREDLPVGTADFERVMKAALDSVFTATGHIDHPRFFGFIPTPSNFVSTLADFLAIGHNPFCGTWLEGSGPATVELVTIEWLRRILGMPEGAGGLFVSGGSTANLTGLIAARESKPGTDRRRHVLYWSDQTHSSVDRAARIAGYEAQQCRKLASGSDFRLSLPSLRTAVAQSREQGEVPLCVVANAGSTNTGAVDPLAELAAFCSEEELWLHVDGAYGAAAAVSERGRANLAGIGEADSITLDPHKWLFQPYPLGCLMVRKPQVLRDFFHIMPEYLRDAETQSGEVNFCDYGLELTRPFRAFKLWFSLKVFGADAFARAVDRGLELAETAEAVLRSDCCWEVLTPATNAIVCFRFRAPALDQRGEDDLQTDIAHSAARDGCCFLSTTALRGRTVLRMCTIQPETTPEDLQLTLNCLAAYGKGLIAARARIPGE